MDTLLIKQDPIPTCLVSNIRLALTPNLKFWLLIIFLGYVCTGTITYLQGLALTELIVAVSKLEHDGFIKNIIAIKMLEIVSNWIMTLIGLIKYTKVLIYIKESRTKYYWQLWNKADLDWLNDKSQDSKEIKTSITKGVDTIHNMVLSITRFLKPFFDVIATISVVANIAGSKALLSIFSTFLLFFAGMFMMRDNYLKRKQINKETNPFSSYLTILTQSAFESLLNGRGDNLVDEIVEKETMVYKMSKSLRIKIDINYTIIETVLNIIIILNTIYISNHIQNFLLIIPIYQQIDKACWRIWLIFSQTSFLIEQASEWAALEEFLIAYKKEEIHKKEEFTNILSEYFDEYKSHREIRLIGKSGCGKTTTMKRIVIDHFRKFNHCFLYLDQKMQIPISSKLKIGEFIKELCDKHNDIDHIIYKYANELCIDNIINMDTINEIFKSPSGGEEKRIMILRTFLPIILDQKNIKIVFCDEITAGLDDENWIIIRSMFEKLKKDKAIIFINIDHHDYEPELSVPVKVIFDNISKITQTEKTTKSLWKKFLDFWFKKKEDPSDLV
jgi:ABC-type transport system involved in cytochrome bd biosynthesis fused ATPase/permease subunit